MSISVPAGKHSSTNLRSKTPEIACLVVDGLDPARSLFGSVAGFQSAEKIPLFNSDPACGFCRFLFQQFLDMGEIQHTPFHFCTESLYLSQNAGFPMPVGRTTHGLSSRVRKMFIHGSTAAVWSGGNSKIRLLLCVFNLTFPFLTYITSRDNSVRRLPNGDNKTDLSVDPNVIAKARRVSKHRRTRCRKVYQFHRRTGRYGVIGLRAASYDYSAMELHRGRHRCRTIGIRA